MRSLRHAVSANGCSRAPQTGHGASSFSAARSRSAWGSAAASANSPKRSASALCAPVARAPNVLPQASVEAPLRPRRCARSPDAPTPPRVRLVKGARPATQSFDQLDRRRKGVVTREQTRLVEREERAIAVVDLRRQLLAGRSILHVARIEIGKRRFAAIECRRRPPPARRHMRAWLAKARLASSATRRCPASVR